MDSYKTDYTQAQDESGISGDMQTPWGPPSQFADSCWPPFFNGQAEKPVKVALVDDDNRIRKVIAQELLADQRIHFVGQAASQSEGRRLIARSDYEVILVDLNLGDGDGFQLVEYSRQCHPLAEIVVISTMEDEDHALHAFGLGATGYLVKNCWFGSYAQAVLQVANGGAPITPSLARRLIRKMDTKAPGGSTFGKSAHTRENEGNRLSAREREILGLVAQGHTSPRIAERLSISDLTVNTHIKNIYQKLQVHTRAQAVNRASMLGLLFG